MPVVSEKLHSGWLSFQFFFFMFFTLHLVLCPQCLFLSAKVFFQCTYIILHLQSLLHMLQAGSPSYFKMSFK